MALFKKEDIRDHAQLVLGLDPEQEQYTRDEIRDKAEKLKIDATLNGADQEAIDMIDDAARDMFNAPGSTGIGSGTVYSAKGYEKSLKEPTLFGEILSNGLIGVLLAALAPRLALKEYVENNNPDEYQGEIRIYAKYWEKAVNDVLGPFWREDNKCKTAFSISAINSMEKKNPQFSKRDYEEYHPDKSDPLVRETIGSIKRIRVPSWYKALIFLVMKVPWRLVTCGILLYLVIGEVHSVYSADFWIPAVLLLLEGITGIITTIVRSPFAIISTEVVKSQQKRRVYDILISYKDGLNEPNDSVGGSPDEFVDPQFA